MTQKEENLGYKGQALEAIKLAGCEVGDIVRVTGEDKTYEGILIPRSESSDNEHISHQDEKWLQRRHPPYFKNEN